MWPRSAERRRSSFGATSRETWIRSSSRRSRKTRRNAMPQQMRCSVISTGTGSDAWIQESDPVTGDTPQRDLVTDALLAWREGDGGAVDRLFPLVYEELHRIADRQLRHERPGHTLNTTAVVHEAYLDLV